MAGNSEHAYATLLMTDNYLPGAMVLGHSLRDGGTSKQLIALVTPETVSSPTVDELRKVYDQVIPIAQVRNTSPGNLYLMGREDLASTFSKIALWSLTQFRKVVYIDADVVALRAPDELFDLKSRFAAVPDVGWPDIFNSGVMALTPNLQDYHALQSLASNGVSFDGADQGLLNMHFSRNSWERLSFTYNCTPSGNYQYTPAYRYFGSQISLIHFIGRQKPWQTSRYVSGFGGVYRELTARWWAVYDKYFGLPVYAAPPTPASTNQSSTYQAPSHQSPPSQALAYQTSAHQETSYQAPSSHEQPYLPSFSQIPVRDSVVQMHVYSEPAIHQPTASSSSHAESQWHQPQQTEHIQHQWIPTMVVHPPPEDPPRIVEPPRRFSAPHVEWDATRAPPPAQSQPEAANFPDTIYEMSKNTELYKSPIAYPVPPTDMYYEVPKDKPKVNERPKAIFPWEANQRPATRVFPDEPPLPPVPDPDHQPEPLPTLDTSGTDNTSDTTSTEPDPVLPPSIATAGINSRDFRSYTRTNAWDADPGIQKYVQAWTNHRKSRHSPSPSVNSIAQRNERRPSLLLTDFPTEVERPSLPVTPAPIRAGGVFWGQEQSTGDLPHAEGVPSPEAWNPGTRLEELQRRQSEIFLAGPVTSKTLPSREQIPSAVDENPEEQGLFDQKFYSDTPDLLDETLGPVSTTAEEPKIPTSTTSPSTEEISDIESSEAEEEEYSKDQPTYYEVLPLTEEAPGSNPVTLQEDSKSQQPGSKVLPLIEKSSGMFPPAIPHKQGEQQPAPKRLPLNEESLNTASTTIEGYPESQQTDSEASPIQEDVFSTTSVKAEDIENEQISPKASALVLDPPAAKDPISEASAPSIEESISPLTEEATS